MMRRPIGERDRIAVCLLCRADFTYPVRRGPRLFCSRPCYDAHRAPASCVCLYCGAAFVRRKRTRIQLFCSLACFGAHRAAPPRPCPRCGTNIQRPSQKFCSKECYQPGSSQYPSQRTCPVCSQSFQVTYRQKNNRFCSSTCRGKFFSGPRCLTWKHGNHDDPIFRAITGIVRTSAARYGITVPPGGNPDSPEAREVLRRYEEDMTALGNFAIASGWPADLHFREVQILNTLAAVGLPLPSRELRAAIGIRTGSGMVPYFRALLARGLLICLPRGARRPLPQSGSVPVPVYALSSAALAVLEERVKCQANTPK